MKKKKSYRQIFYPESEFGGFTDTDPKIAFFNRVNSLLEPSHVVLDVGCGRGKIIDDKITLRKNLVILKGKVTKVIGIDVDPLSKDNPFIDEFYLIDGERWPVEDNSVDLIVCYNVLEHIEHPELTFNEFNRVLKKGGYVCLRTPNAWHYMVFFSKFVPNKYHSKILQYVQRGRKEEDVFPTYYRCNTTTKINNLMTKNGMKEHVVYGYGSTPSYLSFSIVAYYFGVIYQKFSPRFLKPILFGFGKKG